jgi:hypothetical protein
MRGCILIALAVITLAPAAFAQSLAPANWNNTCETPWGTLVEGGQSVTAYQSPAGSCAMPCTSESRTCSGGVLSGSYTNEYCTPSSGVSLGGYCWYASSPGASCDSACSTHGGCNLTGTSNYAGSGGSNANCQAVLNALGLGSGSVSNPFFSQPRGCWSSSSSNSRFRDTSSTTCAATSSSAQRACACNN